MSASPLEIVLDMVADERWRQDKLQKEGRFRYTLDNVDLPESAAVLCIVEEVGEVARNVLCRSSLVQDGDHSDDALKTELIHVAALAIAMAERY